MKRFLILFFSFISLGGVTLGDSLKNQISSFDHVSITTSHIDDMLKFYKDIIGCELMPNGGERSGLKLSEGIGLKNAKLLNYKLIFPNSSIKLELIEFQNPKTMVGVKSKIDVSGYTHICLTVKNLSKTYDYLKKMSVETISPPVVVKQTKADFFYAYDPDGNIIEFVQK